MLSNTADVKPRPRADCHEAAGSLSTGIIEAQRTSESRNTALRADSGTRCHAGARSQAVSSSAPHTAAPRKGKRSEISVKRVLITMLTVTAETSMVPTTATRDQSIVVPGSGSFWIGAWRCCTSEAGMANTTNAASEPA